MPICIFEFVPITKKSNSITEHKSAEEEINDILEKILLMRQVFLIELLFLVIGTNSKMQIGIPLDHIFLLLLLGHITAQ